MFGSMCVVYIHDTHVCCVQHCIGYGRSRIVWVRGVAQATPHFSILEGVGTVWNSFSQSFVPVRTKFLG